MELEELLFTESELFVPEGESVVLVPIPAMLLRADIEVPNPKAPSMSMALEQYIKIANKRKR